MSQPRMVKRVLQMVGLDDVSDRTIMYDTPDIRTTFLIMIQIVRLVSAIGTIVQWLERSVISKRWFVQILPLRSNNALDSITIPIENTKTQSNEFVVTC